MQTRLRLNTPLPDLSGATDWINGPLDYAGLAGRPLLVYFWSASCHLCHETLPTIAAWRERYGRHGVQFVAIHVPRQAADTQVQLSGSWPSSTTSSTLAASTTSTRSRRLSPASMCRHSSSTRSASCVAGPGARMAWRCWSKHSSGLSRWRPIRRSLSS